jgi:GT2 family glycosyltransferase
MSDGTIPTVTCIVLNWNGNDHVLRALRSLHESQDAVTRTILVDNGSKDGSLSEIRRIFPDTTVLALSFNAGPSKARNLAVRRALDIGSEFVFFLDDDAFCANDCLALLIAAARGSSDVAVVTPRILDARRKDVIWYDGGRITRFGDTRHDNIGAHIGDLSGATAETRTVEFASLCAMLVKREVFERVGLFDEAFFMYCEDSDFSFRARTCGFAILHVPSALAWHAQSTDTKSNRGKWFRDYYVTRNTLLLMRKHLKGARKILFAGHFAAVRMFFPLCYFLISAEFARAWAIVAGISDFFRGRLGERYS